MNQRLGKQKYSACDVITSLCFHRGHDRGFILSGTQFYRNVVVCLLVELHNMIFFIKQGQVEVKSVNYLQIKILIKKYDNEKFCNQESID